jgi:L-fuconate dehydratase
VSKIVGFETTDVRFPTSQFLDGSDAMNPDPDYSAAYLRVRTDADDGLEGHAFVFTIGRGNDVQVAAVASLAPWFLGRDVERSSPTSAGSGASWSTTRSCAGWARRRASCTWPSVRP